MEINIGKRIKELRRAQNKTLDDLARATGVAKATLSRLENGKVGGNITTLKKIADSLNVSLDFLVGESPLFKADSIEIRIKEELGAVTKRLFYLCKSLNIKLGDIDEKKA